MRRILALTAILAAGAASAQPAPPAMLAPGETLLEIDAVADIGQTPGALVTAQINGSGPTVQGAFASARATTARVSRAAESQGVAAGDITAQFQTTPDFGQFNEFNNLTSCPKVAPAPKIAAPANFPLGAVPVVPAPVIVTMAAPPRCSNGPLPRTAKVELLVHVRDAERVGAVLDAMAASGATQVSGPTPDPTRSPALTAAARVRALGQARAQADAYAAAIGMRVARVVRISERDSGGVREGGGLADIIRFAITAASARSAGALAGLGQQAHLSVDYALVAR